MFIKLPTNLTTDCKYIIVDIQLKEDSDLNEFGFEGEQIFNHDFFNPNYHIPPTNPIRNLIIFQSSETCFLLQNQCKMHKF